MTSHELRMFLFDVANRTLAGVIPRFQDDKEASPHSRIQIAMAEALVKQLLMGNRPQVEAIDYLVSFYQTLPETIEPGTLLGKLCNSQGYELDVYYTHERLTFMKP